MEDKYAELRAALEAGPTPGPWFADERGNIWRRDPKELYENGGGVAGDRPVATANVGWYGEGAVGFPAEANSRLIAAAHPAAIRALLAERDALVHDNSEYVSAANELATENQRLRKALEAMMEYAGQPISHPAARLARAALAQEQGGSDDPTE